MAPCVLESRMDITPDRWNTTCDYLDAVFGHEDEHLKNLMPRAIERGVPAIAVSPSVGRMLGVLVGMIGAKTIVEVGTLAGYSSTWMARAMPRGGRMYCIEPEALHARVAQEGFEAAGIDHMITIVPQAGLEALPRLVKELGAGSVDVVFLDAIKSEYPQYLPYAKSLLRKGGLLIADNALGGGDWWIDAPKGSDESRDAMDAFNRAVAGDEGFEAFCVPIRQGVVVARRV